MKQIFGYLLTLQIFKCEYYVRNEEMQSIRALDTKETPEQVMKAKFIHKVRISSPSLLLSHLSSKTCLSLFCLQHISIILLMFALETMYMKIFNNFRELFSVLYGIWRCCQGRGTGYLRGLHSSY